MNNFVLAHLMAGWFSLTQVGMFAGLQRPSAFSVIITMIFMNQVTIVMMVRMTMIMNQDDLDDYDDHQYDNQDDHNGIPI